MAGCQHQLPRWEDYQIRAAPKGLSFSVARKEVPEVEPLLSVAAAHAQENPVVVVVAVAFVIVDDHRQADFHVAIDLVRAPVLYSEHGIHALLGASHFACSAIAFGSLLRPHLYVNSIEGQTNQGSQVTIEGRRCSVAVALPGRKEAFICIVHF